MNRALKFIAIAILLIILFRGMIFRSLISYTSIDTRERIEITNSNFLDKIKSKSTKSTIEIEDIIKIARSITNEELSFSKGQVSRDPNELIMTHRANCIGYSAMFNSIANYLIKKNGLKNKFEAKHRIGRLELLGLNLHQLFDSPFFKEHDFNEIINLQTSEVISIDPSVSDYMWIDFVHVRHKD